MTVRLSGDVRDRLQELAKELNVPVDAIDTLSYILDLRIRKEAEKVKR